MPDLIDIESKSVSVYIEYPVKSREDIYTASENTSYSRLIPLYGPRINCSPYITERNYIDRTYPGYIRELVKTIQSADILFSLGIPCVLFLEIGDGALLRVVNRGLPQSLVEDFYLKFRQSLHHCIELVKPPVGHGSEGIIVLGIHDRCIVIRNGVRFLIFIIEIILEYEFIAILVEFDHTNRFRIKIHPVLPLETATPLFFFRILPAEGCGIICTEPVLIDEISP